MGKDLAEEFIVAGQVFEEANNRLGFNLKKLCFEGPLDELTKTENAQLAIYTTSIAAFKVYMNEIGITPLISAGHSIGEITALTCAGAINFEDGLGIVRQRGILMQEASTLGAGAMCAIGKIARNIVEEECKKNSSSGNVIVISNYNSPDQVVISGHKDNVTKVSQILKNLGASIVPLQVSAAFHSPLMQIAADKMTNQLSKYSFENMKWPVVSNVTAQLYPDKEQISKSLTQQITQPVRWDETINYFKNCGVTIAIELGPGTVLKNLVKKIAPDMKVYSFDKEEDFNMAKMLSTTAPTIRANNGFVHTVVTKCIQVAISTQNRNWDNEEYEKGVVLPYRKIQLMQGELEKEGKEPTIEQMREALTMIRSVFVTKKVPIAEQQERFNEIFEVTGTRHLFSDFNIPA